MIAGKFIREVPRDLLNLWPSVRLGGGPARAARMIASHSLYLTKAMAKKPRAILRKRQSSERVRLLVYSLSAPFSS